MNLDEKILSINDLLPDDYQTCVKEALRDAVIHWFRSLSNDDKARILSNMSYYHVFDAVGKEVPEFEESIKKGVVDLINKIDNYSFYIFGESASYEKPKVGQKIINDAVMQHKDEIHQKTLNAIAELSKKDVKSFMMNFQYKLK